MEELVYFTSDTGKTQQGTSSTDQFISSVDLQTGAHASTYKKSSSPRHGLFVSKKRLYALQNQQAYLLTYNHDKESSCQKIILPEKLHCISVSPNETYLAAAAADTGRMLIWELASGNLVFEQESHYQGIKCIEWVQDESFLLTGGDDARVMCWRVVDLVTSTDIVQPVYSWSEHTLPITDIKIGYGSALEARIYTASEDQTVRIWDLRSGLLLTTFVLDYKVYSMCVDPAERVIYTGLENGDIKLINLYYINEKSGLLESRGGAKQIVTADGPGELNGNHTSLVACLCLSFDASLLISGDIGGNVYVWDLAAKQVSRKLKQHKGPISAIFTLTREKSSAVEEPLLPLFKRMKDNDAVKRHDLLMNIPMNEEEHKNDDDNDMLAELKTIASQSQQFGGNDSISALQAKNQELEQELEQMYNHFNKLRGAHDQLWKLHATSK